MWATWVTRAVSATKGYQFCLGRGDTTLYLILSDVSLPVINSRYVVSRAASTRAGSVPAIITQTQIVTSPLPVQTGIFRGKKLDLQISLSSCMHSVVSSSLPFNLGQALHFLWLPLGGVCFLLNVKIPIKVDPEMIRFPLTSWCSVKWPHCIQMCPTL